MILVSDDPTEGIFNGRIVTFHEVAVHKLDSERRLAWEEWGVSWWCSGIVGADTRAPCCSLPTDRLPTTAILRCLLGLGILTDERGSSLVLLQSGNCEVLGIAAKVNGINVMSTTSRCRRTKHTLTLMPTIT